MSQYLSESSPYLYNDVVHWKKLCKISKFLKWKIVTTVINKSSRHLRVNDFLMHKYLEVQHIVGKGQKCWLVFWNCPSINLKMKISLKHWYAWERIVNLNLLKFNSNEMKNLHILKRIYINRLKNTNSILKTFHNTLKIVVSDWNRKIRGINSICKVLKLCFNFLSGIMFLL